MDRPPLLCLMTAQVGYRFPIVSKEAREPGDKWITLLKETEPDRITAPNSWPSEFPFWTTVTTLSLCLWCHPEPFHSRPVKTCEHCRVNKPRSKSWVYTLTLNQAQVAFTHYAKTTLVV